ncbi:Protein argonaute 2 [Bienertia sinuspersici]
MQKSKEERNCKIALSCEFLLSFDEKKPIKSVKLDANWFRRRLVPKISSLNLSGDTSQSKVPITRPNYGGVATRYVNNLVNHFPVHFNPESAIRHYDIDVKVDMGPTKSPVKVSKANLSLIMEILFLDYPEFPKEMTTFDGEKNVFSAVPLPTRIFTVNLSPEEDGSSSSLARDGFCNEGESKEAYGQHWQRVSPQFEANFTRVGIVLGLFSACSSKATSCP